MSPHQFHLPCPVHLPCPALSCQLSTNQDDPLRNSIVLEFYSSRRDQVSVNTMVNGVNGPSILVELGFDCAAALHNYSIIWTQNEIV